MSTEIVKCGFFAAAGLGLVGLAYSSRDRDAPGGAAVAGQRLNPADFRADALEAEITTEPCTLSGGTKTRCYRIVTAGAPSDHAPGPFCPRRLDDTHEEVGIWLDGSGVVNDLDGEFIRGLDDLYGGVYGDGPWQLFDESTGTVSVTKTKEACKAAARPDVAAEYQNHCVECAAADFTDLETITFIIPVEPVQAAAASDLHLAHKVGVALNGVEFDPPAPVGMILGARTIAAFDDCGGHVNPHGGYHYHAALGCSKQIVQTDGHANKIGYALDGYAIYGQRDPSGAEAADLDECRGHRDQTRGYHYHAASPGQNMIIGCFHGELGSVQGADLPARPHRGHRGHRGHRHSHTRAQSASR